MFVLSCRALPTTVLEKHEWSASGSGRSKSGETADGTHWTESWVDLRGGRRE
jgi:hypothetical protein